MADDQAVADEPWLPFAIVSHHRCGSNFLTDVLRHHPALEVLKEPLAQHLTLFVHRDLEIWNSSADLDEEARACLERPFERRYLRDLGGWLRCLGHGIKETRLAEKLPWFSAEVASIRTIALVRDPRAVTASILRRPRLVNYWIPVRQIAALPSTVDKDRARRDVVFRSAAIWAFRYTRLIAYTRRVCGPLIALEDVLRDPRHVLDDVQRFLHVANVDFGDVLSDLWSGPGVGAYSTQRDPDTVINDWRRVLSPAEDATVQAVCGDLMDELGY